MTIQEMFNKAVRGLRKQKFKRAANKDGCMYTTKGGKHCAWGHVDKSLKYGSDYNGNSVYYLKSNRIGLAGKLTSNQTDFAAALQDAHDGSQTPKDMEARLQRVGANFGLKWPK